jgi:putative RNA 2'-phosphotransferase
VVQEFDGLAGIEDYMNDKQLIKISKFLSLVLRHKPEAIKLALDEHGWADVEELLERAVQSGIQIDKATLHQVVAQNNKKRFSFNEDASKIRANQGHSISVDLDLAPVIPPENLYHGTAIRFLDGIKTEGLLPRGRQYVHLSADEITAVAVGSRHGVPVVLVIKSGEMAKLDYKFYRSVNGVWLADKVPVEFILFPAEPIA